MGVIARLGTVAAAVLVVLALAAPAQASKAGAADYLRSRQQSSGGFAEPGRQADPSVTAWAVLGLRAAGRSVPGAAPYLAGKPFPTATDLELRILALAALGQNVSALAGQLEGLRRSNGMIGPTLNSTIWGALALRAAGRPAGKATIRYLKKAQHRSGGFSWQAGGAPDSNDTAAAIQALRAAGVKSKARVIRRAVAYLRKLQNADGGFEISAGRGSDVQSTSWAIQGLLAAGKEPGKGSFAYLRRMQQRDGSFRYSSRYVTTPVWVTAQALVALSRRTFPL